VYLIRSTPGNTLGRLMVTLAPDWSNSHLRGNVYCRVEDDGEFLVRVSAFDEALKSVGISNCVSVVRRNHRLPRRRDPCRPLRSLRTGRERLGLRSLTAVKRAAGRDPGGDGAHDPLGRALREPAAPGTPGFGIVQGGLDLSLRRQHLNAIGQLGFEGLALGGLSVGESPEAMHHVLDEIAHEMPPDRPRYLMGVGRPEDLIAAIGAGVDMFDCVMPTRSARPGQLFTGSGRIVISHGAAPRRPGSARP
jgi:hypothetical protein